MKILELSRIKKNSGTVQNIIFLKWSKTWKFSNGPEYKNSGMVQNIKLLECSRIRKNSGMVQTSKIPEWSRINCFGRVKNSRSLEGSKIQNSGMVHNLKFLEWAII